MDLLSANTLPVSPGVHETGARSQKLILDVDKDKLKAAPGFDKDEEWPDFADRSWGRQVHDYYDSKPYWKSEVVT